MTIGFTIGFFLVGPAVSDATGHVPPPIACDLAWEQAPPGEKWAAQQRCIAAQRRHNCVTHVRPVPGTVTVKGRKLRPGRGGSVDWRNQRHVIGWVVNESIRRGLSRKIVVSAVAATTQESSARELDYGHDTSVGPFQLISDHGPEHLRITVEFSGNWYLNGAVKELRRRPYLTSAELAQAVEASAHPDAYAKWIREAKRTVAIVGGRCIRT